MEVLLNAVWVVLACTALASWGHARLLTASRPRRNPWRVEMFALGCALVLLFPIISVTDDLQVEMVAVEASRGSQPTIKSGGDHDSVCSAKVPHVAGLVLPAVPSRFSRFLHSIDDGAPAVRLLQVARHSLLRAPPFARS